MKKETFLKAVARQQNAMSMAETRMQLLEKALDDGSNETRIFDFTIPNICYEATVDIVCLLFPNIKPEVIEDYISWYFYEVPGMNDPYIEIKDESGKTKKKYEIKTPESMYEFFEEYE